MMIKQEKTLKAAMYIRVSTEEQIEKYGIPLQEAALNGIIASRGNLENGQPAIISAGKQYIYKDEGVSGTTPLNERPGFLQMKEDIENAPDGEKPFDIVVVYRIDRFARKLTILLEVTDYLKTKNIQFISASENIDTSTPFGTAMLGIIGVIAELERETTLSRTRDGKEQARNNGVYMGVNAPFGYVKNNEKRLKIFDKEAEIVRNIFDLFIIEKKSTQQIADHLKEKGVLTPLASALHHKKRKKGKTESTDIYFWRDSTVRKIIKNETYLGTYFYNKTKGNKILDESEWGESPHRHPAIINRGRFEMAQQRIKEDIVARNSLKTSDNHIYLLSGLIKCHACYDPYAKRERDPINWAGTSHKIRENTKRSYYYQCGAKHIKKYPVICKAIPFPAEEIENFVTEFIRNLLEDPKKIHAHLGSLKSTKTLQQKFEKQKDDINKELNQLPKRKGAIKYQHTHGYLNNDAFENQIARITKRGQELKNELVALDNQIGEIEIGEIYTKAFKSFSNKYKNFLEGKLKDRKELSDLIHLIVDQIHVYTRKATESDVIAGRKKTDQEIPNRIRIDLRLPQDIMIQLAKDGEFEVKNRKW